MQAIYKSMQEKFVNKNMSSLYQKSPLRYILSSQDKENDRKQRSLFQKGSPLRGIKSPVNLVRPLPLSDEKFRPNFKDIKQSMPANVCKQDDLDTPEIENFSSEEEIEKTRIKKEKASIN
jgi:hypothetical protein